MIGITWPARQDAPRPLRRRLYQLAKWPTLPGIFWLKMTCRRAAKPPQEAGRWARAKRRPMPARGAPIPHGSPLMRLGMNRRSPARTLPTRRRARRASRCGMRYQSASRGRAGRPDRRDRQAELAALRGARRLAMPRPSTPATSNSALAGSGVLRAMRTMSSGAEVSRVNVAVSPWMKYWSAPPSEIPSPPVSRTS